MKTKYFLAALFLFFFYTGNSQNFMHGVGANISVVYGKIITEYSSGNFVMQVNHFSYFPRFTLTERENSSVSIGSPVGVGINILSNSTDDAGISWGFDLPVVVDYNIGCMSAPDNERGFGGYFGAGFGYMQTNYQLSEDAGKVKSIGPMGRAGIRFSSGQGRWHTTVGMFYKISLEKHKLNTAGFNIYMDL